MHSTSLILSTIPLLRISNNVWEVSLLEPIAFVIEYQSCYTYTREALWWPITDNLYPILPSIFSTLSCGSLLLSYRAPLFSKALLLKWSVFDEYLPQRERLLPTIREKAYFLILYGECFTKFCQVCLLHRTSNIQKSSHSDASNRGEVLSMRISTIR